MVENPISTLIPLRQGEGRRWKRHAEEKSVALSMFTWSHEEKCTVEVNNASSFPLKKSRKSHFVDKLNDSDHHLELVVVASRPH